jgi:hypothetical protein
VKPVVFQRNYQKIRDLHPKIHIPSNNCANRLDYDQLAFVLPLKPPLPIDLVTLLIGVNNQYRLFSLYEKIP